MMGSDAVMAKEGTVKHLMGALIVAVFSGVAHSKMDSLDNLTFLAAQSGGEAGHTMDGNLNVVSGANPNLSAAQSGPQGLVAETRKAKPASSPVPINTPSTKAQDNFWSALTFGFASAAIRSVPILARAAGPLLVMGIAGGLLGAATSPEYGSPRKRSAAGFLGVALFATAFKYAAALGAAAPGIATAAAVLGVYFLAKGLYSSVRKG
jgi:hypothetical protein